MKILASILILIFPLLLLPGMARSQSETVEETSIFEMLERTYVILSNPSISRDLKSEHVTLLMRQVDAACVANCQVPLKILKDLNAKIGSASVQEIVGSSGTESKSLIAGSGNIISENSQKLQKVLEEMDPTKLKYRISASLELTRYLISLEEAAIFDFAEKKVGASEVSAYLSEHKKKLVAQLATLQKVATILMKKFSEHKGVNKNEAAPPAKITAEDAKQIAEAVSEFNLIVFAKFIQSISNNSMLFGADIRENFKRFQDNLPKMPTDVVVRTIREDFGKEPDEMFIEFNPEKPIASATVGQTYRAKIKTAFGVKDVIVKIRRPGLEEALERNRKIDKILIQMTKIAMGSETSSSIIDLFSSQLVGFEDAIQSEFNFESEFKHLQRERALMTFLSGVHVPTAFRSHSSQRVLTMELLPGKNVDTFLSEQELLQTQAQKMSQANAEMLYKRIFDAFLYQTVVLGELHGDLHPGNVLATDTGEISLIDWSHIANTRGLISYPLKMFYYLFSGNAAGFAEYFAKMGRNPEFKKEDFLNQVKQEFRTRKIESRGFLDVILGKNGVGEGPDVYLESFVTLIKESQKFGYEVSPKYFQFFRTALPIASNLMIIGKLIPPEKRTKLLVSRLLWAVPKGVLQAAGGHTLNQMQRPGRVLDQKINEFFRQGQLQKAKAVRCEFVFMNL